MAVTIEPQGKVLNTSVFELKSSAFDVVNYRPAGAPPNSTMSADTPKGVLAGSVAALGAADWEADQCLHTKLPIGLFSGQSEGNPFENSPASASGKVGIYLAGGLFLVYVFETNGAQAAYTDLLASWAVGTLVYCSPYGLLTRELPSAQAVPGTDNVIGVTTLVPTSASLVLGLKLLV